MTDLHLNLTRDFVGKKYKNLINKIASMPNLYRAYEKASKGKRYSCGHLQFKQHLAANLRALSVALRNGTYRPSPPNVFFVNEPKRREISALPFADRVVQHALCAVIEPLFDRIFLPNSYACRKGRGTHVAAIEAQAIMRRGFTHWLKMDFSKYFASIDRAVLHGEIRRKVSCSGTLELIETFLPPTGRGLPIGNLTSQLFANVYGHVLDRYLTHTLRIKNWLRYMDDTVVFAHSREALALLQQGLKWFCEAQIGLRFSKWSIGHISQGLDWLGYRIWPTHKLLRKQSVVAAKRKITKYRTRDDDLSLSRFIASWKGHAQWADSFNLLNKLGVPA
jgi:RNA-directed DNA polymerase